MNPSRSPRFQASTCAIEAALTLLMTSDAAGSPVEQDALSSSTNIAGHILTAILPRVVSILCRWCGLPLRTMDEPRTDSGPRTKHQERGHYSEKKSALA